MGFHLAQSMFYHAHYFPLEYFDTFKNIVFRAEFTFRDDYLENIEIKKPYNEKVNQPRFTYGISTNPKRKIKKVEHYDFSEFLMRYNIKEALWLSGPWIINDDEIDLYII